MRMSLTLQVSSVYVLRFSVISETSPAERIRSRKSVVRMDASETASRTVISEPTEQTELSCSKITPEVIAPIVV